MKTINLKYLDNDYQMNDNTTYKGINLSNLYGSFISNLNDIAEKMVSSTWVEDVEEYDSETEEYYNEEVEISRTYQEVYLGYNEEEDYFVSGFDMWEEYDNPAGVIIWKIVEGKAIIISEEIDYSYNMYYSSGATKSKYKDIKKEYNLIDLRLD